MRSLGIFAVSWPIAAALCLGGAGISAAQDTASPAAKRPAQATSAGGPALKLTLEDALARARKNSVQFQAALTDSAIARQDRFQAGTALLPSVIYNNQVLYTKAAPPAAATQTGFPVVFIANNAVHEYVSQGNIHESIDLASVSNFNRSAPWRQPPGPARKLPPAVWWSPWSRIIMRWRRPSRNCFPRRKQRTRAIAS